MKGRTGLIFSLVLFVICMGVEARIAEGQKPGLKATATSHSVALAWTPSPNPNCTPVACPITSVNINRGPTAGGETLLANVPVGTLPACPTGTPAGSQCFTDSTVVNGQTYFYTVASVNVNGVSNPSNEVTAAIPNAVAPNPPTGLTGIVQ